jgi:nickel-dependent lactate racemase
MSIGKGFADRYLTHGEIDEVVKEGLATLAVDGKRVLVIIPDGTRTMPMPLMYDLLEKHLAPRVATLDYLVALGTHPIMDDEHLGKLVGRTVIDGQCGKSRIFNHHWEDPNNFDTLGIIRAAEIGELTGGMLVQDVPVRLNKLIRDYVQLIICGPVFPHEVAGFSGGTKYFFPGIAGSEIINLTHWFGALMTNYKVIGAGYTPIRAIIDRAAAMIDTPSACLSLVVTHDGTSGIFFGTPHEAWKAAAALSAQKHIVYVKKPYQRVLSVMPRLYDDIWTAGKGMYKMEPAVADGGEVVIFAPHIDEVSYTHGALIEEIGYHCRDYFLAQWDKFKGYPGGILAHSSHVKGLGTYDAGTQAESPRVQVTLATAIPEARCRHINLGYLDPSSVRREEWDGREDEGVLVVPRAGEMLYRVKEESGVRSQEGQ